MSKIVILIGFTLFILLPFASYADECGYLAERFAYGREGMDVTDIAKLNRCISEYLSVRVSGRNNRYRGSYPPPPAGLPPELPKEEIAPKDSDTGKEKE